MGEPVELAVNWHSRFGLPVGDLAGSDYSGVLETIDRLVFDRAELTEKGLALRRGGKVELSDYGYSFTLDVREPNSGPVSGNLDGRKLSVVIEATGLRDLKRFYDLAPAGRDPVGAHRDQSSRRTQGAAPGKECDGDAG